MKMSSILKWVVLVVASSLTVAAVAADFEAGRKAYQARDYQTAVEEWKPLAEQGHSGAQSSLANMYIDGIGVHQDFSEAYRLFSAAAEQGHAHAQANLGWMYAKGVGIPVDYSQAAAWYQRAAEQGHPDAQANLGQMYEKGVGVPVNHSRAATLYQRAAEQGSPAAHFNLALLYRSGKGVPVDILKAVQLIKFAVNQGYQPALDFHNTAQDFAAEKFGVKQHASDSYQSAENVPTSVRKESASSGTTRVVQSGAAGAIVGLVSMLLVCLFAAGLLLLRKTKSAVAVKIAQAKETVTPKLDQLRQAAKERGSGLAKMAKSKECQLLDIGDEYFTQAASEVNENSQAQGLWAKALAIAEGDETKQKAIYIRLRAKQLANQL